MQFGDGVGDAKCDIGKRRLHGGGRFPALRLAVVAIHKFDQDGLGGGGAAVRGDDDLNAVGRGRSLGR